MQPNSNAQAVMDAAFASSDDKQLSFIVFSLGGELYGTPLLATREVIRRSEIKPAPYMVPHFKGVINLRGQIIGVVDLRTKFEITPGENAENLILIIEGEHGPLGAVVDDLLSVEKLVREEIAEQVSLETKIPLGFFMGVAKVRDRLVNMVDIAGCLSSEDLRVLNVAG